MEVAEAEGIKNFAFYRFRSGQNMDIYLGQPCEPIYDVEQLDSLDRLPHRSILFIGWKEPQRDSLFAEWLDGREQTVVGNRSFIIIGGSPFGRHHLIKPQMPGKQLRTDIKVTNLQIDSTRLNKIK